MKNDIVKWLNSNHNFNTGIQLLRKYSRNQSLANNIEGNPQRYRTKLIAELAKIAGYSLEDRLKIKKGLSDKIKIPEKTVISTKISRKRSPKNSPVPEIIRKLINEMQAIYNERALLHKNLVEGPDENTAKNISARKELHALIARCTYRLDILHKAKEDYFERDILPKEKDLWGSAMITKKEAPQDGAKLMKRKKNLESSLSKDRNLLLYQSKTKGDKENPLPAGKYRDKIEERIADKEKELAEINQQLN